jgi:hypothetical protein
LIWVAFLYFYAPPQIAYILAYLMIFLLVTLVFNACGKLFMGDSGTYAMGIAIGFLTIYLYNSPSKMLHADVVVVWFAIPVLDCLRLIAQRLMDHRSPMSPDRNHLHHRLQHIFRTRDVVFLYWLMVAVPGAFAIAMPSLAPATLIAVSCIYLGLLVLTSERVSWRARSMPSSQSYQRALNTAQLEGSQGLEPRNLYAENIWRRTIGRVVALRDDFVGPDVQGSAKATGEPPKINDAERPAPARIVESGPIPAANGVARWDQKNLALWIYEEFGLSLEGTSEDRELRAQEFRKMSAPPRHQEQNQFAKGDFKNTSPPNSQKSGARSQPTPR